MAIEVNMDHEVCAELFTLSCNKIHSSLEIPTIIRATVTAALAIIPAKAGAAGLLVDGQMAFTECLNGEEWMRLQHRFKSGEGVIGHLMKSGRPYISNNASIEPKANPEIDAQLGGVDQLIAVPIFGHQDGLVGCILVFNSKKEIFSDSDQKQLERLASIASVAIDNAIHISESQRVEADLQKSVATYRTLVEQIPAITYIATLDRSQVLFVSPQVESILGFKQDEFLSHADMWQKQIHKEDRERVLSEVRNAYTSGEAFHSEYRIHAGDGTELWFKDAASTVRDNDQALYLQGVMYDITDRKQFESKLIHMAHFDQLTELANRTLFHDRLNQNIAQAKRHKQKFALLYLDLDGFKEVNDCLGHEAGDELLRETAQKLKESVREIDTVARMGGDEFTVILSDIKNNEDAALVAEKILKSLSRPYESVSADHRVSTSIGIAIYPDDTIEADQLVTAADNAMYQAKNSGKNRFCFK